MEFNPIEYNRQCAIFLNWKNIGMETPLELWKDGDGNNMGMTNELGFTKDWNLIMKVIKRFEEIKFEDEKIYTDYLLLPGNNVGFYILKEGVPLFESIGRFSESKAKEEAISKCLFQFFNWYNSHYEIEVWEDRETSSECCIPVSKRWTEEWKEMAIGQMVKSIKGRSWNDCMKQYHEWRGWEPYVPME